MRANGLGHIRRISAGRWQGTLGSAPDSSYKYSIYVNGPYPTSGIAEMALKALPASELGFRGWKYVVVGPSVYAYDTTESLIAACLQAASGQHYRF
jgi:hypothetical protein